MWLTQLSIRRPVFICMVFAILVSLGIAASTRMNLDLNPKIDYPLISVITVYPGAGPEEINTQVTKKIEDMVANVDGVKTITATSQEGMSAVNIRFEYDVPIDVAAADVRAKVNANRADLPDIVQEPVVLKFDINAQPVLIYGLRGTLPLRDLRDLAENRIKPRLSKIAGVAAVTVLGGETREISVGVYKGRLDAYGVTIAQLANLLRASNLNAPSGHIVTENHEISIRVVGEFPSVHTLAATRLTMPTGQTVKVSDIATVQDTVAERQEFSRMGGEEVVSLVVQKTGRGNTVEVAQAVRDEIALIQRSLPTRVHLSPYQDVSVNVEANVHDVKASLVLGAALAMLVVFAFLRNLRGTLIVACSIPTSILATFLPMTAFGFTLNTITLLGLSLSVGILVDDSIVVLENIYRHLSQGAPPVEAALTGRNEIALAAITITLVDVVVFVPMAFMGGVTGQFFRPFGVTVACATLFSLGVSFTIAPMLAARWRRTGRAPGGFSIRNESAYNRLDHQYRRALAMALPHRGMVLYISTMALLLICLMIVSSAFPQNRKEILPVFIGFGLILAAVLLRSYKTLGVAVAAGTVFALFLSANLGAGRDRPLLRYRFTSDQDQGQIEILGETPIGASLAATLRSARYIERIVAGMPDVRDFYTIVGASAAGARGVSDVGSHYFVIKVELHAKASLSERINPFLDRAGLRRRSDMEVAEELRRRLGAVPGATVKVAAITGFQGIGKPLQINITGQNQEELQALGREVLRIFQQEPGVLNADVSTRPGKPEKRVEMDRDKAADRGFTVADIASILHTAYVGDDKGVYRENGNEYKVRVHFADVDRRDPEQIGNTAIGYLPGAGGDRLAVRLRDLATVTTSAGPARIDRMNRQKLVSVTADVASGYAPGNMQWSLESKLKRLAFGSNTWQWGGENEVQQDEIGFILGTLGLSILLVYMLMAALFENLLQPLIILLSLPQALIGALLALMAADQALTVVAITGIIMLVGLVSKNAILLVDYTNALRARGSNCTQALLEACPTRLRPILMTTIAMIFGMLPTALGWGRGAEFRAPLAIPVIGGLILSTVLTLLVIPCAYAWLNDVLPESDC